MPCRRVFTYGVAVGEEAAAFRNLAKLVVEARRAKTRIAAIQYHPCWANAIRFRIGVLPSTPGARIAGELLEMNVRIPSFQIREVKP